MFPTWRSSRVCVSLSLYRGDPDFVFFLDSHESVLIMLQNAEQQVEELKLQLDDALGVEEILVQLTERNLMLSEVTICAVLGLSISLPRDRKSRKCASLSRTWKLSKNSMKNLRKTTSRLSDLCMKKSVYPVVTECRDLLLTAINRIKGYPNPRT